MDNFLQEITQAQKAVETARSVTENPPVIVEDGPDAPDAPAPDTDRPPHDVSRYVLKYKFDKHDKHDKHPHHH